MSEDTLLTETLGDLRNSGKTPDDVLWVGSRNGKYAMPWSDFEEIASFEYDSGFGGQEIADDLVVVGDGWWLERHEYDGSERWAFQTQPVKAAKPKAFATVCNGDSWASIEDMNRPGGKYGK